MKPSFEDWAVICSKTVQCLKIETNIRLPLYKEMDIYRRKLSATTTATQWWTNKQNQWNKIVLLDIFPT